MSSPKIVHVAVGVIERKTASGIREILLAKRPEEVHQGGLWEFPGGKVEQDETLPVALARELEEELGLLLDPKDADALRPLIQISHDYGDKQVLLDVWLVTKFSRAPNDGLGREGQQVKWLKDSELKTFSFPEANMPIITACELPEQYMVTPIYPSLDSARKEVATLFENYPGMILLRQPSLGLEKYLSWLDALLASIPGLGERLMLSVHLDRGSQELLERSHLSVQLEYFLKYKGRVKGLHLPYAVAQQFKARPVDSSMYLAVSCHSLEELQHAQSIQADFASLSPVRETQSHPGALPIGWSNFSAWVKRVALPVYALGGIKSTDLLQAHRAGAQGIAGISAWY